MKMLQKAVSVITAGAMVLTMSVSALAAEYIQLSQEPLDFVHITGEMPEMPGNPAVPIDETAYLMADDATLSISLPEGGTYSVGMAMLDFPAGSGDPGMTSLCSMSLCGQTANIPIRFMTVREIP